MQEASLVTAIRVMELDRNPNNVEVHEALLQQMLHILDKEHNDFIMKEMLDVNKEPQKSYMSEFEGKVSKALKGQRTRRQYRQYQTNYQTGNHNMRFLHLGPWKKRRTMD